MNSKFRYLLTPILIGLVTVSCEQNEVEEVVPNVTAETTSNATAAGVIFEELFEGSNPLSQSLIMDRATGTSYARTYVNSPVFQGSKSARFELRDTDAEFGGGTRTDFAFQPATDKDRWYSFASYFPADAWQHDNSHEVIAQWHAFPDEDLGERWRTPATKMITYRDRLRFDVGYNTARVNTGYEGEKQYDLGQIPKNSWQEFVVHIVHSYGSDGLVEVWQNGKKVIEHKGPNMFNDARLPYLKLGVYKADWNGSNSTDVTKRVMYLDNVRVGDGNASFAAMSSSTTTAPAETQPSEPVTTQPSEPVTTQPSEPVTTQPAPSIPNTTGSITREFWSNVTGWRIQDIPVNKTPNNVMQLRSFEAPSNVGDNYAQRLRGYITAPTTGNYTFWIAADDAAELYLSTSEDPSKKVKIAYSNDYTNPREWNKYRNQRSVSIRLEAGKRYYIEAVHKEGVMGDNLAVGWRLPSGALERPIAGNRLTPFSL